MKKTNVANFSSAAKWLRFLPLLLGLALLSSSDLAAQNYKSLEDATASVKEALEPIQAQYMSSVSVNQSMSQSARQNLTTGHYYERYLGYLEDTQNVAQALARLDQVASPTKPSDRQQYIQVAREALIDLITE